MQGEVLNQAGKVVLGVKGPMKMMQRSYLELQRRQVTEQFLILTLRLQKKARVMKVPVETTTMS